MNKAARELWIQYEELRQVKGTPETDWRVRPLPYPRYADLVERVAAVLHVFAPEELDGITLITFTEMIHAHEIPGRVHAVLNLFAHHGTPIGLTQSARHLCLERTPTPAEVHAAIQQVA